MSVNKVILVGNVGRDPEINYVDKRPYASFSLATSERLPSGQEITEWHNIIMWDDAASATSPKAPSYTSRGSCAHAHGRISTP